MRGTSLEFTSTFDSMFFGIFVCQIFHQKITSTSMLVTDDVSDNFEMLSTDLGCK